MNILALSVMYMAAISQPCCLPCLLLLFLRPGSYPERAAVGCPVVIPLGPEHANGGAAAERVMLERLLAALAPLRRQDATAVQVAWGLHCVLVKLALLGALLDSR